MQYKLKDILTKCDVEFNSDKLGCLLDNFIYDKTVVYKESKKWDIYFKSNDLVPYDSIKYIGGLLQEKFPFISDINIKITYDENENLLISNLSQFRTYFIQYFIERFPCCKPFFSDSVWDYSNNILNVKFSNPAALTFINDKRYNNEFERIINELFKNDIKVNFSADTLEKEKIAILEKRKAEEEKEIMKKSVNTEVKKNEQEQHKTNKPDFIIMGKQIKEEPIPIKELKEDSGTVVFKGKIFDVEIRELKSKKKLVLVDITDYTSSITVKMFVDKNSDIGDKLQNDLCVKVKGDCEFDKYQKEITVFAHDINASVMNGRMDKSEKKRVELHLHTQMSAMDAVTPVSKVIKRAAEWGHKAIAITDHGVVQSFPEAYDTGKKYGVKVIFGLEAYLINDCVPIVSRPNDLGLDQEFTVFDIETTGLSAVNDEITEIGAVKIKGRKVIDEFQTFVNPKKPIPLKIINLTHITDDMVKDAPSVEEVLKRFKEFAGDSVLVAHNASFDTGFIREKGKSCDLEFNNTVLDTLQLSREMFRDLKHFKLDVVARHLNINLENHHRANDDAKTAAEIMLKCFEILTENGTEKLSDINTCFCENKNLNNLETYHAVIIAKNQQGLTNLYKLVSLSHIDYFYRKPRIPKSEYIKHRDGLIIGSGCEAGELFRAVLKNIDRNEIEKIVKFYDYLEIQSVGNNEYLVREGKVKDDNGLREINKKIVQLGERYKKPVVATGDVHFLEPWDEYFRRILMNGQGFTDADYQPPLYFKTTDEMLEEFSYLGEDKAMEVVVDNPNSIADQTISMKPFPDELYPPEIEGSEEEIKTMTLKTAKDIYGDPLPEIVQTRLDKELNSIISHGFAVLYLIAHKLVKKSLSDGYLVGSRGSVGSSLVATMSGITEVNSLPPHYVCPNCKYSDFDIDKNKYKSGFDLPDKKCPQCGTMLKKNGYDIPFEVFLGFKGDKVPDIDLNFSGDYQPVAHKYTEELFGEGHVFRAGTIGTIAEKTAFGFVKNYLDKKGIVTTNAEIKRLVKGCTGVKRTTGQHPGGIVVVPRKNDIHQFTPIQHPADDKTSGIITTHFDFNSLHDRLVKLDILGHDDPTVIRMLEDLTGTDALKITIGEKETMKLFSSTEPLHIKPEDINCPVGTFGIPEFGTRFVRQMLVDTKPTTMAELIRISGLSHGTDVWLNNAQNLIRDKVANLSQVICTRDDIMNFLLSKGVEPTISFKIMENVRKGRGLSEEFEQKMREKAVPDWFIESCKKVKYLFPKAHAAAYVMMAFRIAYYKVYYPEAFYATYFTVRADDFDASLSFGDIDEIKRNMSQIEDKGNNATTKEKGVLTILEIILEMKCRGINFVPIDLYKSDSKKFQITDKGILPPFNALQGLGISAAKSIVEARKEGPFISVEDMQKRAKTSKTVVELLRKNGCLNNMPDTSQICLF